MAEADAAHRRRWWTYRHPVVVRITHWINVVCLTVLLMSGLQIFNAHPALYWGQQSDWDSPLLATSARRDDSGRIVGETSVFGHAVDTTGVLGASRNEYGQIVPRGFPTWATLPGYQSLALGRQWHFFFAWLFVFNGLFYLIYGIVSGHFHADLVPSRKGLRHIGRSILDHARLRFPKGEEAQHYNVLQQLTYLFVIFVLLPVIVLAGLTMSPQMDAAFPELLWLFGGRQSARTIHFVVATALIAFVLVHVMMVVLSGLWNNVRSMITGNYLIEEETRDGHAD